MTVSRVVWDWVLVPMWAADSERGVVFRPTAQARAEWSWAMGVAEALFPLVPRVCRAALATRGARVPRLGFNDGGDNTPGYRSHYFALECAAVAGGGGGVGVGSTTHNGGDDDEASSSKSVREWVAVLRGLCVGGHIESAKRLVDPPPAGPQASVASGCEDWSYLARKGRGWSVEDVLCVSGREDPILSAVCRAGHLGVAKWIVGRFGVMKWELCWPFLAALEGGRLDVAEWIYGNWDSRIASRVVSSCPVFGAASRSGNLDVVKWFFGMFPHTYISTPITTVVEPFLKNCRSEDYIEGCKWFSERFPSLKWDDVHIDNEKTLRWLVERGFIMDSCLQRAYYLICDVKLLQWLLDVRKAPFPSLNEFPRVFENKKDSVPVVKFMLERTKNLPPAVLERSIENSLCMGNIVVANWLEATYHQPDCTACDYKGMYPKLEVVANFSHGCGSLKWVLEHVPVEHIDKHQVIQSVKACLRHFNFSGATFLLERFHILSDSITATRMWDIVLASALGADLNSAKQMVSLGEFSQSQVADSLSELFNEVRSSKVAKWLIEHYHLTADQVKANENELLFKLLSCSKTSCARWLITKFHITLTELCESNKTNNLGGIKFSTWKMLLKQFPDITADSVRAKFMGAVIGSPHHIDYTVSRVTGITFDEIVQHCQMNIAENLGVPEATKLWLSFQH
ncbi:hypothetical protein Pelo_16795 [Pelomyxa schiedti]|nr:hypothetical protein Pelo_16795 [Pelomyxa schiedti]